KVPAAAAAAAAAATVAGSDRPLDSTDIAAKHRRASIAVAASAATASNAVDDRGGAGTQTAAPITTNSPTGALIQKIRCQSISASSPPNTNPTGPAIPAIPLKIPSARTRPGPGRNTLLINASAEGTTSAAAAPWNALPTKSCQGTDETAHIIDAMVKATVPTRNRRRRPTTSERRPAVSSRPANGTR